MQWLGPECTTPLRFFFFVEEFVRNAGLPISVDRSCRSTYWMRVENPYNSGIINFEIFHAKMFCIFSTKTNSTFLTRSIYRISVIQKITPKSFTSGHFIAQRWSTIFDFGVWSPYFEKNGIAVRAWSPTFPDLTPCDFFFLG